MVGLRRTLSAVALGSALVAPPALCQQGSSVSLTHTVSVTVPPRVNVKVGSIAPAVQMQAARSDGLTVSVRATQSWTLSIGSSDPGARVQWSRDRSAGFSTVGTETPIASGDISPIPAVATVFLRNGLRSSDDGSDVVVLTVVAP